MVEVQSSPLVPQSAEYCCADKDIANNKLPNHLYFWFEAAIIETALWTAGYNDYRVIRMHDSPKVYKVIPWFGMGIPKEIDKIMKATLGKSYERRGYEYHQTNKKAC